ncbi:hypothetical protein JRF84_08075 [Methylobacterium organophilum]|uniref:hypothetical protein n=1 Tax=Methylobacterium organophilum TaxID=410 RepID=UPI0019CFB1BF|nr:hypothetical protein [Methylobacterium organophilum]MBN6819545.1 hypothetical protein [Methylobacterium organophilum]
MSRAYDHERLTAEQFSAGLDQAGITPGQFERLTGTTRKRVAAWRLPESDPRAERAPFWVTSWLGLYLLPGGADRARAIAEAKLIGGDDGEA